MEKTSGPAETKEASIGGLVPVYADSAQVEDGTGAAGHIQRHVKLRTTTL